MSNLLRKFGDDFDAQVEATPICERVKSSFRNPTACNIARLGARSSPSKTAAENSRGLYLRRLARLVAAFFLAGFFAAGAFFAAAFLAGAVFFAADAFFVAVFFVGIRRAFWRSPLEGQAKMRSPISLFLSHSRKPATNSPQLTSPGHPVIDAPKCQSSRFSLPTPSPMLG